MAVQSTLIEAAGPYDRAKALSAFKLGDKTFYWTTRACAIAVLLILGGIILSLLHGAWPALSKFGFGFLTTEVWNPVTEKFGAVAPIYGTLVTSLIAMLIAAVWTLLGAAFVRAAFFPLMFLFFAVPMGEFLIQPLMGVTADFTVSMLQATGIPVYREGTFFSIPSGDWSVVEGCSGLRYLIASVTLGVLYAYLTYRSWKRRLLFSVAAMIVPVPMDRSK